MDGDSTSIEQYFTGRSETLNCSSSCCEKEESSELGRLDGDVRVVDIKELNPVSDILEKTKYANS